MNEENTTNTNEEIDLDHLFDDVFEPKDTPEQPADATAGQEAQAKGRDTGAGKAAEEPAEDPEKRSRNAERRVRREQRIADEAYKRAWDEASSVIADIGGIEDEAGNTLADMNALKKLAEDRRKERMRQGNPTESDIQAIVDERLRQAQAPQQQGLSPEERAEVDRQLAEIRAMDPAMTDLNAILQSEAGPKFREYVDRGLGFTEAYKLAAENRLAGIKSNRQGARTGGKDHLTSTSQRGGGDVEVPAETKEMYRLLMPDMTDEQIQKAYNADRRKYGG